jgi:hypothetical protein
MRFLRELDRSRRIKVADDSRRRVADHAEQKLSARFIFCLEEHLVVPVASPGEPHRPPAWDDGQGSKSRR